MKWTMTAFLFYSMMSDSLRFVKHFSRSNNIDKSHNEHHSLEVLYWSADIISHSCKKYTMDELKIISESCLLHDMIDKKYRFNDTNQVHNYIFQKHDKEIAENIMNIISTMSYSKTFIDNRLKFPEWIDTSPYKDAYHIVREADLLSSYNIARMIEYRSAQNLPVSYIKNDIVQFYDSRVANLLRRNFYVHRHAYDRAQQLNEIAKLKLSFIQDFPIEDNNLDFYRFVDFIDLEKLALVYENFMVLP